MGNERVFCTRCGARSNGNYCEKCGQALAISVPKTENVSTSPVKEKKATIEQAAVSQQEVPKQDSMIQPLPDIQPFQQPEKNGGIGKGCFISILALMALIVIIVLTASWFFGAFFNRISNDFLGSALMKLGDFI